MRIYLGVLPAELIQGHAMRHGNVREPESTHPGLHADHLVVTLFDEASGRRLTDGKVSAIVTDAASGKVSACSRPAAPPGVKARDARVGEAQGAPICGN